MGDAIFVPVVLMLGAAAHAALLRMHSADEAWVLTWSFLLHIVSGVGQVLLVVYYYEGTGDMLTYYNRGVLMADALSYDFGRVAPELIKTILQQPDVMLPVELYGTKTTAAMGALASFVLFLLGGGLYASNIAFGIASYVSAALLARAMRPFFTAHLQKAVIVGVQLLPSAVFWSSGMLKEPVVMAALGPLILGLAWLATGQRRAASLLLLGTSGLVIAVIKPYVLMAVSLSAGVFYLTTRFRSRGPTATKPFAIVIAGILAFGGLVVGNRYFGRGDVDAAGLLQAQRQAGTAIEAGSNISLDSTGGVGGSLASEFALAPLALVTALFRPFLFEARNVVQLASALETTALLLLCLQVIRRRRWSAVVDDVRSSPALMFCCTFVLAMALGTGLTVANLGTLSRYRAPMMPFLFMLILVIRERGKPQGLPHSQQLVPTSLRTMPRPSR